MTDAFRPDRSRRRVLALLVLLLAGTFMTAALVLDRAEPGPGADDLASATTVSAGARADETDGVRGARRRVSSGVRDGARDADGARPSTERDAGSEIRLGQADGADSDARADVDSGEVAGVVVTWTVRSAVDGAVIRDAVVEIRKWHDVVDGPTIELAESIEAGVLRLFPRGEDFFVPTPPDGAAIVVRVRAPGYVSETWEFTDLSPSAAAIRRDVILAPAGGVGGVVRDARRVPASGAHVHAVQRDVLPDVGMLAIRDLLWGDARWDEDRHYRRAFTVAGTDGAFAFDDLRTDVEYVLVAVTSDGLSMPATGVRAVAGQSGAPVSLSLRDVAAVTVEYVDALGVPRSDAEIEVLAEPRGRDVARDWSPDARGRLRHAALLPGRQRLEIETDDGPESIHVIDVVPGRANVFRLSAPEGQAVDVYVESRDGRPVAGARVHLFLSARGGDARSSFGDTGADGRHRFSGVRARDVWISVDAPGFFEQKQRFSTCPDELVRFRLLPARTLSLVVRPSPKSGRPDWLRFAVRATGAETSSWADDIESWDDDEIEIGAVPVGGAELVLWGLGHRPVTLSVDVGAERRPIEIALPPAPTRRVQVLDPAGRPVEGVEIEIDVGDHPCVEALDLERVTDADGMAVVEFPLGGAQRFVIDAEGYASVELTIEAGDDDAPLRVRLQPDAD